MSLDSWGLLNYLTSSWPQIDRRYEECSNQIRVVTSAFHVATESDPQMHARFALQTVSALYKSLRERITNEILLAGECLGSDFMQEKEQSFESSFIQKQWALQQLRNDPQSWRPQRGLPEKSVSVLRAWMFQNFLHPWVSSGSQLSFSKHFQNSYIF